MSNKVWQNEDVILPADAQRWEDGVQAAAEGLTNLGQYVDQKHGQALAHTDDAVAAGMKSVREGNVASASKLETPRTIAGVAFDGTTDISIPANNVGAYSKSEADTKLKEISSALSNFTELFDFSDSWHLVEFQNGATSSGNNPNRFKKVKLGNIWFLWMQVAVTNIADATTFMTLPVGYYSGVSTTVEGWITYPVRQNAGRWPVYVDINSSNGEVRIVQTGTDSWTTGRYAAINLFVPIVAEDAN